jgi:hypothetical protein
MRPKMMISVKIMIFIENDDFWSSENLFDENHHKIIKNDPFWVI